ncbi:hypothetical protein F7734_50880 [Scytonema sp. UIC 10036]|uniref:hypothetical protein n=1 Tax=Scytonema sp. UIC 10036 TaxID=2304196 RepID=UPI0012DA6AAF|nr:hypothetical protein [Scytonema sp. UIC 10036]MUH00142.1 hypothetical protein [Scytonema sp. UIC 10036]
MITVDNFPLKSRNLVVNCLLYLQSYPEEIQEDYPQVAPENLVNRTKYASQSGIIAQKKLNELGYRKIKFCGRAKQPFEQFERETVDEELMLVPSVGRVVSPHKRRAHLRKQRYGKGLQQWRFMWIKETTIHRQKYQLSNCYRIYEVADRES